MNIIKTACGILGENYKIVSKSSQKAKQKIRNVFLALCIPALIWGSTGYLTGDKLFGLGVFPASLLGLVFALIVLTIDITFLSANNIWMRFYRFAIVLASCILNSLLFDTHVFEADFSLIAEKLQLEQLKSNYRLRMDSDRLHLSDLKKEYCKDAALVAASREEYLKEADGTGGSGVRGMSTIALGKKAVYEQLKKRQDDLSTAIDALDYKIRNGERQYLAEHKHDKPGLQLRIKAMFIHLFSQGLSIHLLFPLLFILMILLLEFSPLVVKSCAGETDYDNWKRLQDMHSIQVQNIEEERLKTIRKRISRYRAVDYEALHILSAMGLRNFTGK